MLKYRGVTAIALVPAALGAVSAQAQQTPSLPPSQGVPAQPAAETDSIAPTADEKAAPLSPTGAEDIIVTGSRVVANGERAPTPITVVSAQQLRDVAPSITEAVRQLPQLTGSSSPSSAGLTIGGGPSTLDAPNLRNLGANRTLTLLDGRRPPVSGGSGLVDTSVFPQLLIKRVDIVTGGASATYGSDAVAGVVNYVVDTSFKGLSGEVRGGLSSRGDAESLNVQVAAGTGFANDAGRIVVNVNLAGQNGLSGDERDFNTRWIGAIPNPLRGQPGQADLLLRENVSLAAATFGGKIITPGALSNIQFDASGAPIPYTAGTTSTGTLQVGGDGAHYAPTLVARSRQWSAYGHAEYDLSPKVTVFAEGSYGLAETTYPNLLPFNLTSGAYVIRRDNAYLPTSVASAMDRAGLISFQLGKIDLNYGRNVTRNHSETFGAVTGIRAKLPADWALDAYYSYGQSNLEYGAENNRIQANSRLASDAVRGTDGTIVCRSTLTSPNNGCVPTNPFGIIPLTDAQRAYLTGTSIARSVTRQHVASGAVHGEPFSLWAGPVSFALGAEYRSLSLRQVADPIGQANGFTAANLKSSAGSYDVKEIFTEVQVPLLRDVPLAQSLDLNGAFRRTDYSTSGPVSTWKIGATDQVFTDLRLRATYSRDVRAPNISELFGGVVRSVSNVRDPLFNGQIFSNIDTFTGSNSALDPEVAKTLTFGGVYRPGFIAGFGLSVDYYRLKLRNAITTLTAQTIVDQCAVGSTLFCDLITRNAANQLVSINASSQNVQSAEVSGVDFEANYNRAIGNGQIAVRALATYLDKYSFETPGAGQIEQAGTGVLPRWRGNLQLSYTLPRFAVAVQERFVSAVNRATPPVTIDNDRAPATFYTNLTARYRLTSDDAKAPELFVNINNLFDQDPRIGATNSCNLGICSAYPSGLYDLIGRYFTLGVRAKF